MGPSSPVPTPQTGLQHPAAQRLASTFTWSPEARCPAAKVGPKRSLTAPPYFCLTNLNKVGDLLQSSLVGGEAMQAAVLSFQR